MQKVILGAIQILTIYSQLSLSSVYAGSEMLQREGSSPASIPTDMVLNASRQESHQVMDLCYRNEIWISDACRGLETEKEKLEFFYFVRLLEEAQILRTQEFTLQQFQELGATTEREFLLSQGRSIRELFDLLKELQKRLVTNAKYVEYLRSIKNMTNPFIRKTRSEVETGFSVGFVCSASLGLAAGWENAGFRAGPSLGFRFNCGEGMGAAAHLTVRTLAASGEGPLRMSGSSEYCGGWGAAAVGARFVDGFEQGLEFCEGGIEIGAGGGFLNSNTDLANLHLCTRYFSSVWYRYRSIRKMEKKIIQMLRKMDLVSVAALLEKYEISTTDLFDVLNYKVSGVDRLSDFHPFASVKNLYLVNRHKWKP